MNQKEMLEKLDKTMELLLRLSEAFVAISMLMALEIDKHGKILNALSSKYKDLKLEVELNEEEREMMESMIGEISKMVTDVGYWQRDNK